jgi:cell wall-associated NlpC family hydrolase
MRASRWSRLVAAALAAALVGGGCAGTGAVPRPFPRPGGWPGEPTSPAPPPARGRPADGMPARVAVNGYALSGTALALRGAPYRNGGADPSGFDCSGLVQYVFTQHGVSMPRVTREQFTVGRSVASIDVEPGDLVFFSTTAPGASHVGIAIGGDQFVHAPNGRGVVRVESLGADYWRSRFIGARRIE